MVLFCCMNVLFKGLRVYSCYHKKGCYFLVLYNNIEITRRQLHIIYQKYLFKNTKNNFCKYGARLSNTFFNFFFLLCGIENRFQKHFPNDPPKLLFKIIPLTMSLFIFFKKKSYLQWHLKLNLYYKFKIGS